MYFNMILLFIIYIGLSDSVGADFDYYYSSGSPSQHMCYSCMSKDKEQTWSYLQHVYYKPKNFTDNCNRPMMPSGIGMVPCTSVCVVITEMRLVSGHFAGYSFTRGCIHSIAKNGFRNTTLRDYHLELRPTCEKLPRNVIFYRSNPTIEDAIYFCTCFGDRCNDDRSNGAISICKSQKDTIFALLISPFLLATIGVILLQFWIIDDTQRLFAIHGHL